MLKKRRRKKKEKKKSQKLLKKYIYMKFALKIGPFFFFSPKVIVGYKNEN